MEILIYLPTYEKSYINNISLLISKKYGGLTLFLNNKGLWLDNDKDKGYTLYKDDITIIQLIKNLTFKEKLLRYFRIKPNIEKYAYTIADKINIDLKQLSVLIVINHKAYFI